MPDSASPAPAPSSSHSTLPTRPSSPVYLVQIRHMSVYIAGECHCKELCFCPVAVCLRSHSALSDHPCHTLHGHLSSLLDPAFRRSVALHSAAVKNLVCGLLGACLQDLSLVGSPGRNVNANVIVSCCICLQNWNLAYHQVVGSPFP